VKRKIYDRLLEWKESNGTTAMLVEGARGVGKTYIVKEFARNEYESYLLVDFEKADAGIRDLFDDLTDIPFLLQALSHTMHAKLMERRSLIIFDNVQEFPRAREAIKFLVADGRYDYIETGTRVSLYENVKDIVIPSEEESIEMRPMDFEEFCWAVGDEVTADGIRSFFEKRGPAGSLHETFLKRFAAYMLVGGMPESVKAYAESRDFSEAEDAKLRILDRIREDIAENGGRSRVRTGRLFEGIPKALARRDKVLRSGDVDPKARINSNCTPVRWLEASRLAVPCLGTYCSGGIFRPDDRVKLYMMDTGLLVTMAIGGDEERLHGIYSSMLSGDLGILEGMFVENAVALMLRRSRSGPMFHAFYRKGSKNRMEVDFLITGLKGADRVDVRPSGYATTGSLDAFGEEYPEVPGKSYVVWTRDLKQVGDVLFVPTYMAMHLRCGHQEH